MVNKSLAPFLAASVDWTADSFSEGADAAASLSSTSLAAGALLGDAATTLLLIMKGEPCDAACDISERRLTKRVGACWLLLLLLLADEDSSAGEGAGAEWPKHCESGRGAGM